MNTENLRSLLGSFETANCTCYSDPEVAFEYCGLFAKIETEVSAIERELQAATALAQTEIDAFNAELATLRTALATAEEQQKTDVQEIKRVMDQRDNLTRQLTEAQEKYAGIYRDCEQRLTEKQNEKTDLLKRLADAEKERDQFHHEADSIAAKAHGFAAELSRLQAEVKELRDLLEEWTYGGECFCNAELITTRGVCCYCKTRALNAARTQPKP